jgi:hypothetical protein
VEWDVDHIVVQPVELPDKYPGPPQIWIMPTMGVIEMPEGVQLTNLDELFEQLRQAVDNQMEHAMWSPDFGTWLVGEFRLPMWTEDAAKITELAIEAGVRF